MLRNPADMLPALHSQQLFDGFGEDLQNSAEAWEAEADRREGRRLPAKLQVPREFLHYRDIGRYTAHVSRYVETFGRPAVHVMLFDDLVRDTPGSFRDTCAYLGVTPDVQIDFRAVNPNKRLRNRRLTRLLREPPLAVKRLARNMPGRDLRRALVNLLWRINVAHERRLPLDPAVRRALVDEFAADVRQLSALIGRDLTHWVSG